MDHGPLKLEIVDPNRSYAKPKKGVPTFLCYPIEGLDTEHLYVPKYSYSGSNEKKIEEFFNMCKKECENCN